MSTDQAPRESTAGAFGIAVGLALLAVGGYQLFWPGATLFSLKVTQTELDPLEAWASSFQLPDAWPEGLEPTAAAEISNGDGWVRLGGASDSTLPESPPEDGSEGGDAEEAEGGSSPRGFGDSKWEKVDWVALEALEGLASPNEAFLIKKPRDMAASLRDTYFRDLPRRGVDDLDSDGGRVIIETSEILWHGYDANTVHERRFFKEDGEPTFRDSIRVNLSLNEPCVLVALWPVQAAAKIDALQPLLDVLVPSE